MLLLHKEYTLPVFFPCIIHVIPLYYQQKGSDDMKRSELLKLLKKHGCKLVRNGSRHDIFYSPITNQEFPVWRHGKDIPKGTATEIMKQAGIQ